MAGQNYEVSEETQNKLIAAAGELFTANGIEAISVRDITSLTGTVPNAVGYHFGNKNGLIEAVWQRVIRVD